MGQPFFRMKNIHCCCSQFTHIIRNAHLCKCAVIFVRVYTTHMGLCRHCTLIAYAGNRLRKTPNVLLHPAAQGFPKVKAPNGDNMQNTLDSNIFTLNIPFSCIPKWPPSCRYTMRTTMCGGVGKTTLHNRTVPIYTARTAYCNGAGRGQRIQGIQDEPVSAESHRFFSWIPQDSHKAGAQLCTPWIGVQALFCVQAPISPKGPRAGDGRVAASCAGGQRIQGIQDEGGG